MLAFPFLNQVTRLKSSMLNKQEDEDLNSSKFDREPFCLIGDQANNELKETDLFPSSLIN